jgi:hypothetical protein
MKKLLLLLTVLFTVGATAQTTVGNVSANTTVQGLNTTIKSTYNTNIRGTLINIGAVGANDKTTIAGYNTDISTTYTSLNSTQTFVNGEKTVFNQQGTNTTISKNGISTAGSVTAAKMYTQGLDVGNEIINLKDAVALKASAASVTNLTNRVTATEASITELQDKKADKVQVATDIETARKSAISISNTYTDNAAKLLDSKIEKVDQKVEALRLDLGNETNRAMGAEKAITNEMRGLGAISAAMSAAQGSQLYNPTKKGNISIGTGYYNGATAVSAGASYFTSPNTKINANVATGTYTKLAVGVGASFGF